jgi:hypothetical protein
MIWRTGYDDEISGNGMHSTILLEGMWKHPSLDRLCAGQVSYHVHLKVMVKLVTTGPMTWIKINQFIPYTSRQRKYEVMIKSKISDIEEKV